MNTLFELIVPEDIVNYVSEEILKMNNTIITAHSYNKYFPYQSGTVIVCPYNEMNKESPNLCARVKKEWIHEIKRPMNCNQAFDSFNKLPSLSVTSNLDDPEDIARVWFIAGWEECLENERLKQASLKGDAPDISTKENNDAPVDILTWVNNLIKKSPLRYTSDGGLPINDDLRLTAAVEFGEQNDRKRTQPYLEAYENILRMIRQGKVGVAGLYSSVYYDVYFGAKDIDDQYQSLQRLLKKENDND